MTQQTPTAKVNALTQVFEMRIERSSL